MAIIITLASIVNDGVQAENFDLINAVNSFYESAWSKLITSGAVLVGMVGFVIPFVMQWFQNNSLKVSERSLKNSLELEVSKIKAELENAINEKFEMQLNDLQQRLDKFSAQAKGQAFHLQGNISLKEKMYKQAAIDFIWAGTSYSKSEDLLNLQRVVSSLIEDTLPHLNSTQLDELELNDSGLKDLIEALELVDDKGSIVSLIRQLKIMELNIRKPASPVSS